jgi:raffinose/stachyose/melibiose transport system substrate-binding protein
MINREKLFAAVGLALLLGTFALSLIKVARRAADQRDPSVRIIRIAHWQLEDGASTAIDAVAREYERLHPGVRIEQMRIPEKVYPNWVTTQLVGGTAPDLIQIGKGIDSERTARYFRPITDEVLLPNPYNRGTAFENTPWRDTYVDGMIGGFDEALQDYYGAPLFMATVRMYANLGLLRQVTGSTELPRTLDELLVLSDRVQEHARRTGRALVPIAGSKYNAPILIERLFRSTTQRYALELSPNRQMVVGMDFIALGLLRGEWSLRSEPVQAGLTLASDVGRRMQPGFLQLAREDATFLFQQGRALFIATGSWDATTLFQGSHFPIGVLDLPAPSPSHPEYGRFVLGRHSEAGARSYGPFGITRGSAHPELALDFMRFITSAPYNQLFADRSGWLPVITGVNPHPSIAPFAPVFEGYPDGFYLNLGADSLRVVENNLHLLFAPGSGVEQFTSAAEDQLRRSARSDLNRMLRVRSAQNARADLIVSAEEILLDLDPDDPASRRRAHGQHERQFASEIHHAHLQGELERR